MRYFITFRNFIIYDCNDDVCNHILLIINTCFRSQQTTIFFFLARVHRFYVIVCFKRIVFTKLGLSKGHFTAYVWYEFTKHVTQYIKTLGGCFWYFINLMSYQNNLLESSCTKSHVLCHLSVVYSQLFTQLTRHPSCSAHPSAGQFQDYVTKQIHPF